MGAFEKGLCWSLYKYMEADFVRFLDYVPYTRYNRRVYSPRLLAMLLQICGYIDTVFKEMAKFRWIKKIPECEAINKLESQDYYGYDMSLARDAFERIYRLSFNNGGRIIAKLDWFGNKELTPFNLFGQGKSPEWWRGYNRVKHIWSRTMRQANMDNALEALSGAFLLNAVHYPSVELLWKLGDLRTVMRTREGLREYRVTRRNFLGGLQKTISELGTLPSYLHMDFRIETPLFIYITREGSGELEPPA